MYLKKNIVLQFLWNIEHSLWKGTSWTWLNSSVIPTIFQGFEHICDADHILIFLWHWFSYLWHWFSYLWHWLIDLRATLNMPLGSEESVECSEEQGGVFCISLFFFSLFFLLFLNFSLPFSHGWQRSLLLLLPEPDVPHPGHPRHRADGQPHVLPRRPIPLHVLQVPNVTWKSKYP